MSIKSPTFLNTVVSNLNQHQPILEAKAGLALTGGIIRLTGS